MERAAEHFVQHHAETIEITSRVGIKTVIDLLRAHVVRCARAIAGPRQVARRELSSGRAEVNENQGDSQLSA